MHATQAPPLLTVPELAAALRVHPASTAASFSRERPESGGIGCCLRPTPTLRPPMFSLLLLGLHGIGGSTDELELPGGHTPSRKIEMPRHSSPVRNFPP